MKKSIVILFSVIVLAGCSSAEIEKTITTSGTISSSNGAPKEEQAVNLTGIWDGILTHELVEGGCPPTPTQQGTVLIEQTGSAFTMEFSDGFDCSPLEACDFTGTVEGMNYSATNGGIADNAGGTYTTSLTLTAMSDKSAMGIGGSVYEGPGLRCEWSTSLSITKRVTE